MSEIKNIKGIDDETWADFKSLAARNRMKAADMFRVIVKDYESHTKNFWNELRAHKAICTPKEYAKMEKKLTEGIFCVKCDVEMKRGILPRYEFEEGYPLHNVQAYLCPKCSNIFFTEEQANEMEARTAELKEYTFGFERKVTISGKSLVVGIPSELVDHLNIKQGQKVRIIPVAKDGFMIRKLS